MRRNQKRVAWQEGGHSWEGIVEVQDQDPIAVDLCSANPTQPTMTWVRLLTQDGHPWVGESSRWVQIEALRVL